MAEKTLNVFEIAQLQVKHACDKLGTDPAVYEILKNPMRVMEFNFPVKMDDGTIKTFTGKLNSITLNTTTLVDHLKVV